MPETNEARWVCIDPGEDTGFSIWEDNRLIFGQTIKMWTVAHLMDAVLEGDRDKIAEFYPEVMDAYDLLEGRPLERMVVEDWRLYPWVIKAGGLDFDQCRTARVIGALTFMAQKHRVDFKLQGANIKDTAEALGAENFYFHPLHENRHINDSIQHGIFWLGIEESRGAADGR